jgi:hypothetical protein
MGTERFSKFDQGAAREVVRRTRGPIVLPEVEDVSTIDIDAMFQRRMARLRYLPRRDRPAALRAARDERALALRALREKKVAARRHRRMLLRLLAPTPRG